MSLTEGPSPAAEVGTAYLPPGAGNARTGGLDAALEVKPTVASHLNEIDNAITYLVDRLDRLAHRLDPILTAEIPADAVVPGGVGAACDIAAMIADHTRRVLLAGRRLDDLADRVNL